MSWRDAPLYVEAFDVCVWLDGRVAARPEHPSAPGLAAAAATLVEEVALALTFPQTRFEHLRAADQGLVRLRQRVHLAREAGLISPRGARHIGGRLTIIGRMIGGWRKRVQPTPTSSEGSDQPLTTGA